MKKKVKINNVWMNKYFSELDIRLSPTISLRSLVINNLVWLVHQCSEYIVFCKVKNNKLFITSGPTDMEFMGDLSVSLEDIIIDSISIRDEEFTNNVATILENIASKLRR